MTFKHVKDEKSTPIFQNKNDINFYFLSFSRSFGTNKKIRAGNDSKSPFPVTQTKDKHTVG